jgi:hypothetical protein
LELAVMDKVESDVTTKDGNLQKTKTQELLDAQVELLSDEQESRGKEGGLLEVYTLE